MGHGQADSIDFRKGLERALARIQVLQNELAQSKLPQSEPIAVVGIGCRFPSVDNHAQLWQFLINGGDAVREVPATRPELSHAARRYPHTRWMAAFDAVDGFDARFFGISPREAMWLDPQQRLLLEVSTEALEDAGIVPERLEGTRSGVFLGMIAGPGYEEAARQLDPSELDFYTFTGVAHGIAAGRIAFTLGLRGPAMVVDTACSSSLVAIHLACQSLRQGETDLALAGGVNLILSADSPLMAAKVTALSEDGRCRTFDATANGIARGEGAGMVVLKRLRDARAAGDQVLAVVRGSAINHDGRAAGLAVPSALAQQAVLRDALQNAAVDAASIDFVETHGTGTSIGDPIELGALKAVFGAARSDASRCFLGALKSNLGHTESTAGVAGFIKAVLALRHAQIPPNLHFRVLNPRISLRGTPLAIPTQLEAWPSAARPRRAGVSSFGMSGTNAHVVLEAVDVQPPMAAEQPSAYVLAVSARDSAALVASAQRFAARLDNASEQELDDICFSAGQRRSLHPQRLAVTGVSQAQLRAGLLAFAADGVAANVVTDSALAGASSKVLFVFSGFGSQTPGMGRELYAKLPSFRAKFDACSAEFVRLAGISLIDMLHADAAHASWQTSGALQVLLFAVQLALVEAWRSWGVVPDAVVGASLGEVAAAHVAGALSLADAVLLAYERANQLEKLLGSGSMLSAELSVEAAAALLQGRQTRVGIASCNSPRSLILSGDTNDLTDIKCQLDERGTFCRWVRGATAPGHSPAVDRVLPALREALSALHASASVLPFYSTVTADKRAGHELNVDYWLRNMREPVSLSQTLSRAVRDGYRVLLEISAHPILVPAMREVVAHEAVSCAVLGSQRRDADQLSQLNQSLAELFVAGAPIDWQQRYPSGRAVSLPTYPFQRKRFWVDVPDTARFAQRRGAQSLDAHPLLGSKLELSVPGLHVWERTLRRGALPWLTEQRLLGAEVMPSAVVLEMVARAMHEVTAAHSGIELRDLTFRALPVLQPAAHPTLQLVLSDADAADGGMRRFRVSQAEPCATGAGQGLRWRLLAEGRVRPLSAATADVSQPEVAGSSTVIDAYVELVRRGLQCGAALQTLQDTRCSDTQLTGQLALAPAAEPSVDCWLEPTLLEACFHALTAAAGIWQPFSSDTPLRCVSIDRLRIHAAIDQRLRCELQRADPTADASQVASLVLRDAAGAPLLIAESVRVQPLTAAELLELEAARPPSTAAEQPRLEFLAALRAASGQERLVLVQQRVRAELARVLRARPEDVTDDIPFAQQGVDSVVGLEARHRLELAFELELPVAAIYAHPDVVSLSKFLLEAIGLATSASVAPENRRTSSAATWLLRPVPRSTPALRLLVFPFSGGSASSCVSWASRLPDQIELCAIELPGHGFRLRETAHEEFAALLDALDRHLRVERERPYALFGHSMGALVAFELARRWSADGARPPSHLFASGLPAPQWFTTGSLRDALAEDRLLEHLESWGAVAPTARDRDLLALGLPALRADLAALATWSYQAGPRLTCPITALRGNDDTLTPLARSEAWSEQTAAAFRLATFPGGHFYLQVERALLLRVLADDLACHTAELEAVSIPSAELSL